jgi:TonB family protein
MDILEALIATLIALFVANFIEEAATLPTPPAATGSAHNCTGYYPTAALRAGAGGTVELAYRIGTDGAPNHITVAQSSTNPALDAASVACVSHWRYKPAMQGGKPVEIPWRVNIVWRMK